MHQYFGQILFDQKFNIHLLHEPQVGFMSNMDVDMDIWITKVKCNWLIGSDNDDGYIHFFAF